MKPHPRIRKSIKWGGALSCVAVAVAFAVSLEWTLLWHAAYLPEAACSARSYGISRGALFLSHAWSLPPDLKTVSVCTSEESYGPLLWLPAWEFDNWPPAVAVPLWIPFILIVVPTALAFYRDRTATRRRRLGRCEKCDYDRTGIAADAKCPECGAAV